MKCAEVQNLLPDYSVHLLDVPVHQSVEAHLQLCADCRRELAAQDAAMALVAEYGALEPPPGLFNAVRNRIEGGEFSRERPAWWAFLFTRPARVAAMGLAMGAVAFGLLAPIPQAESPVASRSIVLEEPATSARPLAMGSLASSIRQHALAAGQGSLADRVAWEAMAQLVSQETAAADGAAGSPRPAVRRPRSLAP